MNRIVLAYAGGLDTSVAVPWLAEHVRRRGGVRHAGPRSGKGPRSRCASGRSRPAPSARTSWTCARNSPSSTSCRPSRPMPSTRAGTRSPPRWAGRSSRRSSSRSPASRARPPSPTAAPARATTRCASRCRPARSCPALRVVAPARESAHVARGEGRVRQARTASRCRRRRRARTRSTRTSGDARSSAACSKIPGSSRRRTSSR